MGAFFNAAAAHGITPRAKKPNFRAVTNTVRARWRLFQQVPREDGCMKLGRNICAGQGFRFALEPDNFCQILLQKRLPAQNTRSITALIALCSLRKRL
jgi:hypothetical protein